MYTETKNEVFVNFVQTTVGLSVANKSIQYFKSEQVI